MPEEYFYIRQAITSLSEGRKHFARNQEDRQKHEEEADQARQYLDRLAVKDAQT